MTSQAFRFIHASDFRLELPVDGLSECPERLESAILDAPRVAVERLVATALKEKVDFVVLSGDLLSPRETGPWGLLFLIEQFERLASEKIAVYWAAGKNDSPDVVPAAFRFPENVRISRSERSRKRFLFAKAFRSRDFSGRVGGRRASRLAAASSRSKARTTFTRSAFLTVSFRTKR